jgi:SAM-dependent methyltransferase
MKLKQKLKQIIGTIKSHPMANDRIFSDIYKNNVWGGKNGKLFSGGGSHDPDIIGPYIETVRSKIMDLGLNNSAFVDLGCGDFNVGSKIYDLAKQYIGVDVVSDVVEQNTRLFGNDRVEFRQLDIVNDSLPDGDVCFVRQVFQHLSNQQIAATLSKLMNYKYIFVTEHHPDPMVLSDKNIDKVSGSGIRLEVNSGVFLDAPPFNVDPNRVQTLLEVNGKPGIIRTFLLIGNQRKHLLPHAAAVLR